MNENLKDQDILLVKEKGSNELSVANTGKDGKVKQTSPDSENPDLLKIDRHGNILENFFENFMRQVKNPTRFEFFRVPAEKFKEVVRKLQNAFKNPEKPENRAFIDLHRINPEDFLKKQGQTQAQTQTPENSYAINPDSIHWDKLEKFGITRESLEKTGNLAKMLDYRKTDLMPVSIKIDDETTLRTDARFSLRRQQDGTFVPAVHPIRHKPDLERPYFGVTFSEEDRKNLLTNGNLGRVVNAEFRPGEKTSILLSLDKLTNFLKRDKKKANGLIPLFCRITVDGQEVRFGMKCDVNPKYWDVKTGKAMGRTVEAININVLVDSTKATIYRIYRELQERDHYVTAERVRNVFLGAETKQQTLLELFDRHNRERGLQVCVNICRIVLKGYIRTRERLADFIRLWYNVSDIPVKEIDPKFINDFETYLVTNYQLAHNTLAKYLKNLRHIIGIAIDSEMITKNPFSRRNVQYINTDRGFLTQDEIDTLIGLRFDSTELEQARDIFLFCCFTGLSYTDLCSLKKENIQLSCDGKLWIKGRRQKTDTEYNIPLLNIPKMILKKYEKQQTDTDGKLLPVKYLQKYNSLLKEIVNICGIDKRITSHLARHTFATTIALSKGVPIESVSKMPGHTSIKTTQIYARILNSKISSDMDALAEKLKDLETTFITN